MFGAMRAAAQANQTPAAPAPARRAGVGNQARLRRLAHAGPRPSTVAKAEASGSGLVIGAENDPLEFEADRIADQVMRAASPPATTLSSDATALRRACQECNKEEEGDGDIDPAAAEDIELEGDVASEIRGLHGGGAPLPAPQQAFFESRFGRDFGRVRLHDNATAARLARTVSARAFTLGNDIVFGAGEYSPGAEGGDRLLAHELAHVVQQGQSQPFVQRLGVNQTTFTSGSCGKRNVQWAFSLDNPAADAGYIVQHVSMYEFIKSCPDKAIGPPALTQHFWEAWPIAANAKVHPRTTALGRTDLSIRPAAANKNGIEMTTGELKFFARSVTGDLGDFGVASSDPASAWGPGKVKTSGAVPSTPTQPSWWSSAPVEGPADRSATSQWDCCDPDAAKQTSTVTAKP